MSEEKSSYDFNAPQFFDFGNMDAEDEVDLAGQGQQGDDYFAFDHERGVPVELQPTAAVKEVVQPRFGQDDEVKVGEEGEEDKPSLVKRMLRQDTPKRKNLREAVAKTVETANNSPKIDLAPRNRSRTPILHQVIADGKVSKGSASGTGGQGGQQGKLIKAIKKVMTPDILRRARKMTGNSATAASAAATAKIVHDPSTNVGERLSKTLTAAAEIRKKTVSSTAASSQGSKKPNLIPGHGENWVVKVTKPTPFSFDKKSTSQHQNQPLKANSDKIDFTKMLRTYQGQQQQQQQQPLATTKPQPFKLQSRRERSRSVDRSSPYNNGNSNSNNNQGQSHLLTANNKPRVRSSSGDRRPFSFVDKDLERIRKKADDLKNQKTPPGFVKTLREYKVDEEQKPLERTVVNPFSFEARTQRRRSRSVGQLDKPEVIKPSNNVLRAKPAPHFGVPTFMDREVKQPTISQPFSFENRDKVMMEKKEKKIEQFLEEEKKKREFKANPLPDLKRPIQLPIRELVEPTRPKPFDLAIDKRVEPRLKKWEESVQEELKKQKEAAQAFKAQQPKVLERDPFIPAKSDKPLAEVSNFELHSDRRARDREAFEMHKKYREADLEAQKLRAKERERHLEAEEIKRLRREAVHKAQPVRHYKPVDVVQSEKPLTIPVAPNFSQLRSSVHHKDKHQHS